MVNWINYTGKVLENIKNGYIIRNETAHGGEIDEHLVNKLDEILAYLLNYLRISLIIFLQKKYKDKDQFIDEITQSLISVKKTEKMQKFVENILKKYKISIYDFDPKKMIVGKDSKI